MAEITKQNKGSRAERRARAEAKRQALSEKIFSRLESLAKSIPDAHEWTRKANEYISGLIRKTPQDGALIRSAAVRVHKLIQEASRKAVGTGRFSLVDYVRRRLSVGNNEAQKDADS